MRPISPWGCHMTGFDMAKTSTRRSWLLGDKNSMKGVHTCNFRHRLVAPCISHLVNVSTFLCITQQKVPLISKVNKSSFRSPFHNHDTSTRCLTGRPQHPADWSFMQFWVILVATGQQQLASHLIRLSSRHVGETRFLQPCWT